MSCPLCRENHEVNQCKSKTYHRTNCFNLKNAHNIDVDTNHTAWDKVKCVADTSTRDKLRNDILGAASQ